MFTKKQKKLLSRAMRDMVGHGRKRELRSMSCTVCRAVLPFPCTTI